MPWEDILLLVAVIGTLFLMVAVGSYLLVTFIKALWQLGAVCREVRLRRRQIRRHRRNNPSGAGRSFQNARPWSPLPPNPLAEQWDGPPAYEAAMAATPLQATANQPSPPPPPPPPSQPTTGSTAPKGQFVLPDGKRVAMVTVSESHQTTSVV